MTIQKDENIINLNNNEIHKTILDNTSEIIKKDIIIKCINKISEKLKQNSNSSQKKGKTKISFQERKYIFFFVCVLILIIVFILFLIK